MEIQRLNNEIYAEHIYVGTVTLGVMLDICIDTPTRYKMEQPRFPFFFFFCFGGCNTILMAASNTAFTFCIETYNANPTMRKHSPDLLLPQKENDQIKNLPVVILNCTRYMQELQLVS